MEYIVIDVSEAYHISVSKFKDKQSMLDAIQHKEIDSIQVYEVSKRIRLTKRPVIVEDDC